MIRTLLIALAMLLPTAAPAAWHEAISTNFVVYSEGSQEEARTFAQKLEKFNFVLRRYHNVREVEAAPRFRVFLVENVDAVQRMAETGGIGGYYIPESRALMFVGTRRAGSSRDFDPEIILFHEYVHHFMFQYFPATYPVWYSEGYAEFWGSTRLLDNDVIEVGHPQEGRFGSFFEGRWVPMSRLLTAQSYADVPDLDLLYAEGWMLNRYMFENRERRTQLQAYLRDINAGMSYRDAMNRNFGENASALNSELFEYAGRTRYNVVRLPFRTIDVGPIAVRTLPPVEQALLESEVKISQGVSIRDIAGRAATVRTIAGRFPNEPVALNLLAEAEQLAGNQAAALAAVNRLLQVAPDHPRGLMRKGLIEAAALRDARSADSAAWTAARRPIRRAIQLAPNDPLVFQAYYDSFVYQGVLPPDDAQNALYTAHELAPSDEELNYKLALDFERRDLIREAIAIIRPDAFRTRVRRGESVAQRRERERREDRNRPAGTQRHETALEMLTRLQARLAAPAPAATPPRSN
jgi:tetratricopeptide (TPR) repeat protein